MPKPKQPIIRNISQKGGYAPIISEVKEIAIPRQAQIRYLPSGMFPTQAIPAFIGRKAKLVKK